MTGRESVEVVQASARAFGGTPSVADTNRAAANRKRGFHRVSQHQIRPCGTYVLQRPWKASIPLVRGSRLTTTARNSWRTRWAPNVCGASLCATEVGALVSITRFKHEPARSRGFSASFPNSGTCEFANAFAGVAIFAERISLGRDATSGSAMSSSRYLRARGDEPRLAHRARSTRARSRSTPSS